VLLRVKSLQTAHKRDHNSHLTHDKGRKVFTGWHMLSDQTAADTCKDQQVSVGGSRTHEQDPETDAQKDRGFHTRSERDLPPDSIVSVPPQRGK